MILDLQGLGRIGGRIKKVFTATFRREGEEALRSHIHDTFIGKEIGIYIHFPFCRGLCPACPYVREIAGKGKIEAYVSALKAEIRMVGELLSDLDLKVVDVHAGGGTPSLIGREWAEVIETIGENFNVSKGCSFGIEANPEDLTEDKVALLIEAGVREVSIGVQSFFKPNLRMLGRRHSIEDSLEAIENCKDAGFALINIDMMYMIPNQTAEEWAHDLRLAAEQGVDQITCYPLLVPPYTRMHELMRSGRVPKQPGMKEFKRMYYACIDVLGEEGYHPLRYYSFGRGKGEYSTVELEMVGPLIGFGCGAMSFTGGYEYINTCSSREYVRAVGRGRLPVAGGRIVSKEERAVRWVSERLSALKLKISDFEKEFGEPFDALMKRSGYSMALRIGQLLGHLERGANQIRVTRKGMWSRSLGGWAFVLSIPCRIVEEYLKTPWPFEVTIP
ncbi:MAG: hypothetical protein DRN96_04990 [Thermoproteota archaeon]|nr:MAG: hypothetical protein DRN96_04990 [Candidatus Korarchaeota archaeon]RLG54579.1 MAG: hypothetical protein DRN99_04830 [Candidatus Korarchaeota archaeon]